MNKYTDLENPNIDLENPNIDLENPNIDLENQNPYSFIVIPHFMLNEDEKDTVFINHLNKSSIDKIIKKIEKMMRTDDMILFLNDIIELPYNFIINSFSEKLNTKILNYFSYRNINNLFNNSLYNTSDNFYCWVVRTNFFDEQQPYKGILLYNLKVFDDNLEFRNFPFLFVVNDDISTTTTTLIPLTTTEKSKKKLNKFLIEQYNQFSGKKIELDTNFFQNTNFSTFNNENFFVESVFKSTNPTLIENGLYWTLTKKNGQVIKIGLVYFQQQGNEYIVALMPFYYELSKQTLHVDFTAESKSTGNPTGNPRGDYKLIDSKEIEQTKFASLKRNKGGKNKYNSKNHRYKKRSSKKHSFKKHRSKKHRSKKHLSKK
jgi:hypothetical protein